MSRMHTRSIRTSSISENDSHISNKHARGRLSASLKRVAQLSLLLLALFSLDMGVQAQETRTYNTTKAVSWSSKTGSSVPDEEEHFGEIVEQIQKDPNAQVQIEGYETKTTVAEDGTIVVVGQASKDY